MLSVPLSFILITVPFICVLRIGKKYLDSREKNCSTLYMFLLLCSSDFLLSLVIFFIAPLTFFFWFWLLCISCSKEKPCLNCKNIKEFHSLLLPLQTVGSRRCGTAAWSAAFHSLKEFHCCGQPEFLFWIALISDIMKQIIASIRMYPELAVRRKRGLNEYFRKFRCD